MFDKEAPIWLIVTGSIWIMIFCFIWGTNTCHAIDSSSIIEATNNARIEAGLLPLRNTVTLKAAAQLKANDEATNDYFAHTSPSGKSPWYWFHQAGYKYYLAGENLAKGFDSTEKLMDAWMKSPKHRANIMNPNYKEIGIAMAKNDKETYIVQLFGAR